MKDVSAWSGNMEVKTENFTWNGSNTIQHVNIPVTDRPLLFAIENNSDQDLTVTFEHEVEKEKWYDWYDGTGTQLKFISTAGLKGVYGPFQGFPKFLQGRLVFTADSAPTQGGSVKVRVQKV